MPNCCIYCRVSTEEQADKGFSLDTQEKLCGDFAQRSGYKVVGVFRDEGKSGTNLDRPALQELLSRSNKGNLDAIIIQETDRLARNTKDHLTIKAVLKKSGIKLISVAQPMLDDSPEGMMIDTILASVNQFQSDINSRKTQRGLQERFDQGWWPGPAPLGYINIASEASADLGRTVNIIKKDPVKWELVKEGFALYMTGNYSADEVGDILFEKGLCSRSGKKVAHSVMVNTLRNPFYAGILQWKGQEHIGRHEPMITRKAYERVLQIMESHNLHACRRRKHNFLLRGFAYCNICNHRYTGETHPKKHRAYYHCTATRTHSNRQQNVDVLTLEQEVAKLFKTIQFSESFRNLIVESLRTIYIMKRDESNTQKQALHNKRVAIEKKRDIAEDKLLESIISDDDFKRLRKKYTAELALLQDQLEEVDYLQEIDLNVVQDVLKLSHNIYEAYMTAPVELKRLYLRLFWSKFLIQDRKIVQTIPTDLVSALQQEQKVIIMSNWLPGPLLIRTLQDTAYMEELKALVKAITDTLQLNLT